MSDPFAPGVGGILSADIAVPEHEREMHFYSRILSTGEHPLWREDLLNNMGMPVIGLGERTAAYSQLPLQWMPHIQVADVAISVERALDLGGRALLHDKDEDNKSRWAVLLDPNGAAFGVMPVVAAEENPLTEDAAIRAGNITWVDLTVSNATATRDFYREVVGWSVQDVEMEDTGGRYVDFNMSGADGKPAAGVCHARGVNQGLPPVWMIYLPVDDLPESLRRVREGGGKIIATHGTEGEGAYAVIQDPVGVYLALSGFAPGGGDLYL